MDHIQKAVKILNDGGIVIFPTDTAFGIGCLMENHSAVERLFLLRHRPLTQPTPVLINSLVMAKRFGEFSDQVIKTLVEPYWPGALTIIVPAKDDVDPLAQKDGHIGLRLPNSTIIQAIISGCDAPVLGPSANFAGQPTPFTLEDLDPKLVELVDYVVPGQTSGGQLASTVIDTTKSPMEILRHGGVEVVL